MTLAVEPVTEDAQLTALARRTDPAARVIVDVGTWWLVDELGRLALGADRMAAARDLAHYLELLEEAASD